MLPTATDLPLMSPVKRTVDPLLGWAPPWLHAALWAVLVFGLCFAVLSFFIRRLIPVVVGAVSQGVPVLVHGVALLALVPDYLLASVLRRHTRRVPGPVYAYGDAVEGFVSAGQRLPEPLSGVAGRLRRVSPKIVAVLVLALFVTWNGSYCNGRSDRCAVPTSEWADDVSAWVDEQGEDERR